MEVVMKRRKCLAREEAYSTQRSKSLQCMSETDETAALGQVKDYYWTKDILKIYFDTCNGMLGPYYSTKFSPWLARGCLSPR